MTDVRNKVLEGRQVIDGKTYYDCEFKNAQLVFKGDQPPGFSNCKFTSSRFEFEGKAANTVHFLRAMLPPTTGLRGFVTGMMPEIGG